MEQNKTMPQKCVFSKYPLLSVHHSFLSCGLVRSEDQRILNLYKKIQSYLDNPSVWEGTFRLAAMLTDNPISEPITQIILDALVESDNGSFQGSIEQQIATARAAMALFEYNTDRSILRRIASWCRYLEIDWDLLFTAGITIFSPADLMELFVRFFQITGIKSVLRLCSKLRSVSFDWTTALHTIQQIIPLEAEKDTQIAFLKQTSKDQLDYNQKQVLLNHAEMLADGMRYSVFAGIFSGNKQDLTAAKTAWSYLRKHYGAICGGTTSTPFLDGSSSSASIDSTSLAAWTEAFASVMSLPGSEWATDELIRIFYNSLSYCLNAEIIPNTQYVNNVYSRTALKEDPKMLARLSRAASFAFSHALTITEKGIRINYLVEAKFILMIRKQPLILRTDGKEVCFSSKNESLLSVDIFKSKTDTADISVIDKDGNKILLFEFEENKSGHYVHAERQWNPLDRIVFDQVHNVYEESTHHQGLCWFVRNRLQVYQCDKDGYQVAASEAPDVKEDHVRAKLYRIEGWHIHHDCLPDIPVLPAHYTEQEIVDLIPYDQTETKIGMFPRISPLCLK